MLRRCLASAALVAVFFLATASPVEAVQARSAGATTVRAEPSPAVPWSLAGFWGWIQSIFDEEHGQIVP